MGLEDFSYRRHYRINCSGFINHSLISLNFIKSLQEIRDHIFKNDDRSCYKDSYYPRALTFVRFMQNQDTKKHWIKIQNVREIQRGDIIAYATKLDKLRDAGQHVMIVSGDLIPSPNQNLYYIPIFDSTSGNPKNNYRCHGDNDYRGEHGGLGEGIIGIETNDHHEPIKFKWYKGAKTFEASIVIARINEQ